jgi:hypothetical protein
MGQGADDSPDEIEASGDRNGRRNEKGAECSNDTNDTDRDSCDNRCWLKVLDKINKSRNRHRGGHE